MVDVENPDKYTELKSPFGKFAGYRSIQSFHVLAKTLDSIVESGQGHTCPSSAYLSLNQCDPLGP